MHDNKMNAPPAHSDDEWSNTATHAIGILIAIIGTLWMISMVQHKSYGLILSCMVYCTSVILVFTFSTLSHACKEPSTRTKMRAWDQGTIFLMISGSYTPFVWQFGGQLRTPLLIFLWVLALYGLWSKVVERRRVNSMSFTTYSLYLLLGWIPAIPLALQMPSGCLLGMLLGGVIYSLGVIFLIYDHKGRFYHAVWHLSVIAAAACHYLVIVVFIVNMSQENIVH